MDTAWDSAENSSVFGQWLTEADAVFAEVKLSDGLLVHAAALLHYGDCLAHFAAVFEISQQNHRVGQVTRIHRALHVIADHSMLRDDHHRRHASQTEI